MPTPTYTALANLTLGSSATTVTFSSIGQSFSHLVLLMNLKSVSGTASVLLRPNNDTGFNYGYVNLQGNGSGTNTLTNVGGNNNFGLTVNTGVSTSEYSPLKLDVFNYTGSKHKPMLVRNNRAGAGVEAIAGRWYSTSAINSLYLSLNGGDSFASGSTFALYGIVA